jgi:signal transduction histidine kinase
MTSGGCLRNTIADMTAKTIPWRIHLVDAAVVVLLLLFAGYGIGSAALGEPGMTAPDAVEYVLGVMATVPLLFWRRFPLTAFGLVAGAVAVSVALGYDFGPVMFQLMLATAVLTWTVRGWPLVRLGIGYGVVLIGAFAIRYVLLATDLTAFLLRWASSAVLWLVLPAVVGVALRAQQETKARVRAERARRAAAEEQLRIAQELHDLVGHGLAVIAMQASAGQHVLERDPERAGQALSAIQDTARAALDGLRAEVASLHPHDPSSDDSGAGGAAPAPRHPGDGISQLPRLVERIRGGGVSVVLDIDPGLEPVSADTDHAAYRIAQEALTNVLRHGGPQAVAHVDIRSTENELTVEVTNTALRGHSTPAHEQRFVAGVGTGVGISGMHRRARQLGGQVETGCRPDGGFRVSARLPLHRAASAGSS